MGTPSSFVDYAVFLAPVLLWLGGGGDRVSGMLVLSTIVGHVIYLIASRVEGRNQKNNRRLDSQWLGKTMHPSERGE